MRAGELHWLWARGPALAFSRTAGDEITAAVLNPGEEAEEFTFPWPHRLARDVLTGQRFAAVQGRLTVRVPGMECMVLV